VCEGAGDRQYFEVLLPRILDEISRQVGIRAVDIPDTPAVRLGRRGSGTDAIVKEVCDNKAAFHVLFIHGDTGGRALERRAEESGAAYCTAIHARCDWPTRRCVVLTPRHETEAWVLGDPAAVAAALGFTGPHSNLGLPTDAATAEQLTDPKAVLSEAARIVRGRRSRLPGAGLFAAIANRQEFAALRASSSFHDFETRLRDALADLGCL